MFKSLPLIVLTALAMVGCSSPGGSLNAVSALGTGQSFRGQDVDNFNVRDERTLYISSRQGFVFRLDAADECFALGTSSVTVTRFRGVDPRISAGDHVIVSSRQIKDIPVSCVATVAGPITDSRVTGLRSRTPGS